MSELVTLKPFASYLWYQRLCVPAVPKNISIAIKEKTRPSCSGAESIGCEKSLEGAR